MHSIHAQNAGCANAGRLPLSKPSLSHKHRQKDHFQNEINFDRQKIKNKNFNIRDQINNP